MTPQDVPGPVISVQSLFPWLSAVTPKRQPLSSPAPKPTTVPLREAA